MAFSPTDIVKFKDSLTVAALNIGAGRVISLPFSSCTIAIGKDVNDEDRVGELLTALQEKFPGVTISADWVNALFNLSQPGA